MPTFRKIVEIDEQTCDGCGQCVPSCAEGAIQIIAGKARLIADVYCDGLGACLGQCPQGAITLTERAAEAFDEDLVRERLASLPVRPQRSADDRPLPAGCPGVAVHDLRLEILPGTAAESGAVPAPGASGGASTPALRQWPVQLHLVPPHAPFLQGADLVLAADCVPVAFADFHARLLRQRPLLIGCPKLDDTRPYVDKLAAIFRQAAIRSLTVIQMEVPCCTGLLRIAEEAAERCGRSLPIERVVVSIRGEIVPRSEPVK